MHTATVPPKFEVDSHRRELVRRASYSVFWRIFLWFWLAMLLLGVAVAMVIYFTDPDQFLPRRFSLPVRRVDLLAAESVKIYEEQGSAGLRAFLARIPSPSITRSSADRWDEHGYLFDVEAGRELSGLPQRSDMKELVRRTEDSKDLEVERLFTQVLVARAVNGGRDGHRYVFLLVRPRDSFLLTTGYTTWLQIAAAVAVSAAVCYWLARHVVGPVRRLQTAARQLAAGDLDTRVSSSPALRNRRDEFSELAVDFDDMASRIQSLLATQRRLIADISHELGSPLTRVNVALGLARRKAGEECHPELERIGLETQRLNELIRQLLLLSELENQPTPELRRAVDLVALAKEIAVDAEFEAGNRRCAVRVTSPADKVSVRGVYHLLRSALENVVRNAVRYTAPDTEVRIELSASSGEAGDGRPVTLRVRDHGPGVPPQALAHLFEPFYRVSEARDRQSGGAGLGLAITHQAVEAHHGTVQASNHPEGGLSVEIVLLA